MTKTFALCLLIFIFTLYIEAQTTVDYFTAKLPSPGCPAGVARVRRAWKTLSESEQQIYVKTVLQMKALKMALRSGSSTLSSVYNLFVQTHYEAWNAYAWHGTSIFLPVHKWYLFNFESALRYTAYIYSSTLGITKTQACDMALPYWDWETDYDADDDGMCPAGGVTYGSKLLESNDFGSQAGIDTSYMVTDGVFASSKWNLWFPMDGSYRLRREFNCNEFPLMTSAAEIMYQIIDNPNYLNFAGWLEGLPHGWPHMNLGWTMSMMNSPDDPVFMLHHCNIDRIYAVWQDCYDYELVSKTMMTSTHYAASSWPPINPYSDKPYNLGIDSPMPYAMSATGSRSTARAIYSVVFPSAWPTPRDMWSSIDGYKGLNVRYGPDAIVNAYGGSCTNNANGWTLVNFTPDYIKRDVNGDDLDLDQNLSPKFKEQKERLQRETKAGRSHHEVIKDMAMEDCVAGPKIKITPKLLGWIKMNNLHISQFDTLCDKVSERADQGISTEGSDNKADLSQTGQSVPLWVILTASIGSTILLIAIVTLIIIYLRKRNGVDNGKSYTEMKE